MGFLIFTISCVDQTAKLTGDFALSGFDFDVEPPIPTLISTHAPYTNNPTLSINIETGIDRINCASFDRFAITESNSEPSDSAFTYTCTQNLNQTISYNLINTSEGDRSLYFWAKDDRADKVSVSSRMDFILDTTAPTGTISAVEDFVQGGSSHNLTFTSSDNLDLVSTALSISHNASGSWESITHSESFFFGTDVTFPVIDSSASTLRYLLTDAAGNTTEVLSNTFIIDSTSPSLAIDDPTLYIAGGSTYSVTYSATDLNGFDNWSLSYSQDNGASYTLVAANPYRPYSWTVPMDDTNYAKLRLAATDVAGNGSFVISSTFTVDSTPPAISLTNPPTWLQGGSTYNINFSATDFNGIQSFVLEYAADGTTFTTLTTSNAPPFAWSVPVVDISANARLRMTAIDLAGNTSTTTSSAFGIDSTAPTVALSDMAAIIRGAISNNVTLSSSDAASGIASANLEYSNDSGATYSLVTAFPATPTYSWSTPGVDIETARLRYVVTDVVGNQTIVENAVFEIDSTAPAASLSAIPSILQGGDTLDIILSASDKNGLATYELQYASNGTTFSTVVSNPTSPYTWTIPLDDVAAAKLRILAIDPVGNQTIIESSSFEVDSTRPSTPTISLYTPQYTNLTAIAFTMALCDEHFDEVLINTGAAPVKTDAAWQTCSETNGAITYTLPAVEGPHALSAWAKDDAGNISATSTDFTVYYDVTNPVLSVTNPGLLAGNTTYTIYWTITETYIDANRSYDVDYWNGSAWVDIATVNAITGPHTAQSVSTSWTTPGLDRTDIKLRVQVQDLAGNSASAQSTTFEIDSTFPPLTIATPAANSYHRASAVLTGSCETGLPIYFTGALQTDFNISCSGGSYSQTINFSDGDGNKLIYVSQTDPAGNNTNIGRTFIRDEIAPILTLTSGTNPDFTNANQPNTWSGTCEGTYTITITGDQSTTIPCSSGTWSWTAGAKTSDGTYSYALTQTDAAGNTTSPALSLSWERDATPPLFNMASPVAITANQTVSDTNNLNQRTLSGSCEGSNTIAITGAQTDFISCSASSWSWTTATYTTDATRNFTLSQSDSAGNITSFTYRWIRDTTGPQLTLDENMIKSNTNTVTFGGDCEVGLNVVISGTDSSSVSCPAGTWSYTTASRTSDATRSFTFTQTFTVSPFNSTAISGTWIRETNIPTISAFSTTASDPSRNAYIPVDLQATSQNPNVYISEVCFTRIITTPPAANDNCWIGIDTPAIGLPLGQTLTLDDYYTLLGWQTQSYDLFPWVKDEAGNISALSNSGNGTLGQDKLTHGYDPGIAPELFDVTAANVNNPQIPPTRAQSSVPAGQNVYIRWRVTDNNAMPNGSIALFYTTDDVNYTEISTAQNLDPYANTGCGGVSLGAGEGCYLWPGGSPLDTPYKILVKATDLTDITTQMTSNNTNTDLIKIIAGNTEKGIGGSAQTAIFVNEGNGDDMDPGTLVYTDDGRLFFADSDRGILTVDKLTGKLIVFIADTDSSTGDGGAAVNATLNHAVKITLDYQGRMLIFDRNRIRRVDLNQTEPTITTIIGGGSDTADTVANPLNVQFETHDPGDNYLDAMPFFAMPNGDIVFMSERPVTFNTQLSRLRIYKSATGQVISKRYTGTGDYREPTQDLIHCRVSHFGLSFNDNSNFVLNTAYSYHDDSYANCDQGDFYSRAAFDPVTFVAVPPPNNDHIWWNRYPYTGMDGKLYVLGYTGRIDRMEDDGSFTLVLGTGTRGECPDGTPATSCNINTRTFFVNSKGEFFFVDAGSVRVIDTNGNVKTILGQRKTYGDGDLAVNARFEVVRELTRLDNGEIVVIDGDGYYIKQFAIEGNINVIAGNGNLERADQSQPAAYNPGHIRSYTQVDKASGDIYYNEWSNDETIIKLNRSTGYYEEVVGDPSGTHYDSADGLVGMSIDANGNQNRALPVGVNGDELVMMRMKYNSTAQREGTFRLKGYDISDSYRQFHMGGLSEYPADGDIRKFCSASYSAPTSAATCDVPYWDTIRSIDYDSNNNRWIMAIAHGGTEQDIFAYNRAGGTLEKIGYVSNNIMDWYKFVYHGPTKQYLYYCNTNGRIRAHDLLNNVDLGLLDWPIANMTCQGYRADYNPDNNSLVFPFLQNGLYGVAEYYLPY